MLQITCRKTAVLTARSRTCTFKTSKRFWKNSLIVIFTVSIRQEKNTFIPIITSFQFHNDHDLINGSLIVVKSLITKS